MNKKLSVEKKNISIKMKKVIAHIEENNVKDDVNDFVKDMLNEHVAKRIKK